MIIMRVCRHCGKDFEVKPHARGNSRSSCHYCSVECRFFSKVDAATKRWIGGVNKAGYGRFMIKPGHKTYAHIWAWEYANGRKVRPGFLVLHKNDDPRCVDPDLLYEGTHEDNMRDMVRRKRYHQKNPHITREKALEIRVVHAQGGWSLSALAAKFGVSERVVTRLVHRKTWKNI